MIVIRKKEKASVWGCDQKNVFSKHLHLENSSKYDSRAFIVIKRSPTVFRATSASFSSNESRKAVTFARALNQLGRYLDERSANFLFCPGNITSYKKQNLKTSLCSGGSQGNVPRWSLTRGDRKCSLHPDISGKVLHRGNLCHLKFTPNNRMGWICASSNLKACLRKFVQYFSLWPFQKSKSSFYSTCLDFAFCLNTSC